MLRGFLNILGIGSYETIPAAALLQEQEQSTSSKIAAIETDGYVHVPSTLTEIPTALTKEETERQAAQLALGSPKQETQSAESALKLRSRSLAPDNSLAALSTPVLNKSPNSKNIRRILNKALENRETRIFAHKQFKAGPQEYKKFVHALYPNVPLSSDEPQQKIDNPNEYKKIVRDLYPNAPLSPHSDIEETIPLLIDEGLSSDSLDLSSPETQGYQMLSSRDFSRPIRTSDMEMDADAVVIGDEKEEYCSSTSDDLIGFFTDISPEFAKLKNQYQDIALTLSPQEKTILFPTLQHYGNGASILNFREVGNLAYVESVAKNIAAQFNQYMAYNLPRLKMHSEMVINNLASEHHIQQASAVGLEFAEQMRRTSHAALDLLTEAESKINMDAPGAARTRDTLSSIIRKLSEARDELTGMQTNVQKFQATIDQANMELNSSRLVSSSR
jgi:hypothetical protein